jgi:hypothetical protein
MDERQVLRGQNGGGAISMAQAKSRHSSLESSTGATDGRLRSRLVGQGVELSVGQIEPGRREGSHAPHDRLRVKEEVRSSSAAVELRHRNFVHTPPMTVRLEKADFFRYDESVDERVVVPATVGQSRAWW